ncbi:hypothetical protein OCS_05855 [Ophiocordyceps sinensis CO18]|uniref:Proteophosphoglycan ppg4 n=1 Tax=Ophiocordyceps sinensis (strain Co18 / CGMCC 3.14243) TaxID=911162 RepID=T5A9K2_OPHSC|nr:hypothetical protein OCS_05855 [Ophiocordyceps sinensis CO18]
MGNTPSSETPRRVPHKLLKPRPASLSFDLAELLSPSSDSLSSPASTRYCHSYLAGSRRTMSYQHLPSSTHDDHSLYRQSSVASISPSPPRSPGRQSEPLDAAWSQLHEPHAPAAASISDVANSDMREPLIRAKSVVYPSRRTTQSLSRPYSFHCNADTPYHPSVQLDMEKRRFSAMESIHSLDGYDGLLDMDFSLPHTDDAPGVFAQAPDSNSRHSSIHGRANSNSRHSSIHGRANSTSYVPMRRRSIIQTPGVATRVAKDHPPLPTKSVSQISRLAPTAGPSSASSISSDDYFVFLTGSTGPDLQERCVTPCDADYRQLGGIKFGTLRVINVSPIPSPASHNSDWTQLESPPVTSTQASLVTEELAWPLEFHISHSDTSPITIPNQNTPRSPPRGGPGTGDRQTSPGSDDETAWSKGPSDVEWYSYTSPEVLDVQTQPCTKSRPKDKGSRHSSKRDSVGSESGFVSSTTSSRQSSQRTLSKVDSGYSSNFSLRSIRSNSFRSRRHADKAQRASEAATPKSQERQSLCEDDDSDHLTNQQSTPLPRNSLARNSREKIRRRCSTQTSKIPRLSPSASKDQLAGPSASETIIRRTTRADFGSTATPRSSQGKQETPNQQGKLQSFLGSARRQSRVTAFVSPHDIPEHVPAIPFNLEEKLHGQDGQLPSIPDSKASPTELGQQPQKTAGTEDGVDVVKGKQHGQVNGVPREPAGYAVPRSGKPRQPSYTAIPVPAYSSPSYTERPMYSIPHPIPIRRRPLSVSSGDERCEAGSEKTVSEARGQGKDGSDARGLGRASVHEAAVSSPTRTRRTLTKTNPKTPTRLTRPNALKSRASAPNLGSSPTSPHPPLPTPSLASSKAAPPMSFRNCSMKTARDLLPSQAFSPEATPLQESSRESFHWQPQSERGSESAETSAQPQMRHSYSVHGGHPPVVYRQPQERQTRDSESHNFRLLHSYNSPAYKNAPVWG